MASTTTIGGMTAVTSGNLTGAALMEVQDAAGNSTKSTLALLRTNVFAGGTGFTATDPLTAGATSLQAVTATTVTLSSLLDAPYGRFSSVVTPAAGAGVEVGYNTGRGLVQAFDRTGAVFKPLDLFGDSVRLVPAGNTALALTVASSGAVTIAQGLTVSAGGITVNAGTSGFQAVTATSATLSGSGAGGGLLLTGADPRIIATPTGNPFEIGTSNANNVTFFTNNSTVGILTSAGSFVWGTAALATTATDGFLYIPTCAGAPTGVPTAFTGRLPMVYDTTNHKFWMYDTAWKSVVLA